MSMRRFGQLVLVIAVLVAATSSAAPTAVRSSPEIDALSWSPSGAWLAYAVRNYGDLGRSGLYLIRANRTGMHHPVGGFFLPEAASLQWSPKGTQLAASNGYRTWLVTPRRTVMEFDGRFGDWSPDGSKFLLVRDVRGLQDAIWVGDAKTGATTYLFDGYAPRWSPDGARIAYSVFVDSNAFWCWESHLYSIAPDGTSRVRLATDPEGYSTQTATDWSPDSAWVAFIEQAGGPECTSPSRVILAASDGSRTTHVIGRGLRARWLPGGRHLALEYQNVLPTVRIVKPSGKTVALFDSAAEYSPSADGRRLVFSEPGREIWVAGIDGKNRHRLAGGHHPSWSSQNWIAFSAEGRCGRRVVERVFMVRPNGKHRHVLTRC